MSEILPILLATGYSLAIFGISSSILSLWIIYKFKILHNAFGLISAAQSIVEGCILFDNTFIVYTIIAIIQIIFLEIQIQHKVLLLFLYLFNFIDSCFLIITPSHFTWTYSSKGCTEKFAYLYITWNRIGILGLTFFFDGITLLYLRIFRKRLLQNTNKKLMKAEIRFFFQTFLTSIFYTTMLLSPRILRQYATTSFSAFLTASATFLLFHSTNEFFFFIFTLFINKNMKSTSHNRVKILPKIPASP